MHRPALDRKWAAVGAVTTVLLTLLVVGTVAPRRAAANQWDCDLPSIPLAAVFGSGAAFVAPASGGTFSLGAASTATLTAVGTGEVAAGTAGAVAVAGVGGTVALGAATFIAAAAGTCKFLDWVLGDGKGLETSSPVNGSSTGAFGWCPGRIGNQFVNATYQSITGFTTFAEVSGGQSNPTGEECAGIGWGSIYSPGWNVTHYNMAQAVTDGVTTYPRVIPADEYRFASTDGLRVQIVDGSMPAGLPAYSVAGYTRTGLVVHKACHAVGSDVITGGIGGVCGIHPEARLVLSTGPNSATPSAIRAAWPVSFLAKQKGWKRVTYVTATCRAVVSPYGSTTVATTSAPYWDREVTTRIAFPQCPTGAVPVSVTARRCPTGLDCTNSANGDLISSWSSPSSWATAGGPAWVACLAAGSTCTDPVLVGSECSWNGVSVAEDFCSEAYVGFGTLGAPVLTAAPAVTTVEDGVSADTSRTPSGETGPTGPSGVVTVVGLQGVLDTRGDTETLITGRSCLPSGWGLFNPITWVYEPIKCALQWATQPSEAALEERTDTFQTYLDAPPLSYVAGGLAFVSATVGGAVFVDWADEGPACVTAVGRQVCPRSFDSQTAPLWFGVLIIAGLWFLLAIAIFRSMT